MKADWFYICSECGSVEWSEYGEYNELQSNGNLRTPHTIHKQIISWARSSAKINICFQCDTTMDNSNMVAVPIKLRKQVAKMTPEKRIIWLNEYRTLKKLEDKPNFVIEHY